MKKKLLAQIEGTISISSKGTGYVSSEKFPEDIEIDAKHLKTALHGDSVLIALHPKTKNRQAGEVLKVIKRAKAGFSGVIDKDNGSFFFKADDTKMYRDILVPEKNLNGAQRNQKVFVEISRWEDWRQAPEGRVIKIFGRPGENNAEMQAIAMEKGFDSRFPEKVEREAEDLRKKGIQKSDIAGRRDFRNILTFTIDPSDAKDFDDAISFQNLGSDFEVGVHIADVSHYVLPGSELDNEAKKRGTSVYLVDRTIPMLPEALSNDLCSLVPNQDRLTMSAVFILDKEGTVKEEWYGKTVINSQKRFTYEEAEEIIKKPTLPFHKELALLNSIAKKLTGDRFENGAISLDQEEVKFVLGKNGVPEKVIKKVRGDSNRLIEEFMLLANKKVAKTMTSDIENEGVFVYRIHDFPSREKMEDLAIFLRGLGHKVSLKDGLIPTQELNKILESLAGKNEKDTVHRAVVRSMAKAIYSTENIGHYGLAFEHYTHFTSPIRRYPDVLVHRFLEKHLQGKKETGEKIKEELLKYDKISKIASEQEKRAQDAERASVKYKQVEYMSTRLGKEFEGVISGIAEWGIYIEEVETKCEGLVRIRDMNDDFYILNEKKLELVGQRKKKHYLLGNRVRIKVKAVDLERKTIDYSLV